MSLSIDGVAMTFDAAKKLYPAIPMVTLLEYRGKDVGLKELVRVQSEKDKTARSAVATRKGMDSAKRQLRAFMTSDKGVVDRKRVVYFNPNERRR